MKFDTVIIGGGLSGLTAGIELARQNRRVAIISAGQSSMHFCSGSFELLGYGADCAPVSDPLAAIAKLGDTHPYSRIGRDNIAPLARRAASLLSDAGVVATGTPERNHWRLTPVGETKPAWLTLEDYISSETPDSFGFKSAAIVNLRGFLDFFPGFLADALSRRGVTTRQATVTVRVLDVQRTSSTEMRAPNIARVVHGDVVSELAEKVNLVCGDAETVLFPAVLGFADAEAARTMRSLVKRPLRYVATMGASVPGIRTQMALLNRFRSLGGHILAGDRVIGADFDGDRLRAIHTANLGADAVVADDFIFAAGSFFSHGLASNMQGAYEPALGLDVDAPADRLGWFDKNAFARQPFMKYGVATGHDLRARRGGRDIANLRVIGSSLPGADSLREGSGAGVAMLSALRAADLIANS